MPAATALQETGERELERRPMPSGSRTSRTGARDGRLFGRRRNRVGLVRVRVFGAVPVVAIVAAQAAVRFDVKEGPKKIFVKTLPVRTGELGASTTGANEASRA